MTSKVGVDPILAFRGSNLPTTPFLRELIRWCALVISSDELNFPSMIFGSRHVEDSLDLYFVRPATKAGSWALLALTLCSSQCVLATEKGPCAVPQATTDAKYSAGQIWGYKTRPGESDSTVTILRVETLPKIGEIVHLRIDEIRLRNCSGGPGCSFQNYLAQCFRVNWRNAWLARAERRVEVGSWVSPG
jgi:hypothetical protein